ncbi:hypothetical protein [Caballeronia sp. LZ016]|uniref:hypothetical protein n=1 Tax=Caballeronia sp. LZ016 TaxID=3038554 RepID=UPI00286493DF|nr:hypothetical protein [Caballeronia sp. LZ016]MDR5738071.1 hypothetical protein [Caballeronia sp. LZ016]
MYKFSEAEWAALRASDERNFVLTIKEDIVTDRPDLVDDHELLNRLNAAYEEAKRIGFTDDKHLVMFLWLDSVQRGFYMQPAMAAWLNKRGVSPEERFDMMMDVARGKLREKQEAR